MCVLDLNEINVCLSTDREWRQELELLPSPTSPLPPAVASHCLNANCDRYGDPALQGYCSRCARARGTVPLPSSPASSPRNRRVTSTSERLAHRSGAAAAATSRLVTSGYGTPRSRDAERTLASVEHEITSARLKCRYQGCNNYGNPNNQGYCNAGHIECDTSRFLGKS